MKRLTILTLIIAAMLIIASNVFAASYSGSLSEGIGTITATDRYDRSSSPYLNIAYNVVDNNNGTWTYNYSLNRPTGKENGKTAPGVSHFILETSAAFKLSDIIGDVNVEGVVYNPLTSGKVILGDWGDEGGSNPNIPAILHGLKFDIGGADNDYAYTISFTSLRMPVLGDFYVKGGLADAWNSGFTANDLDLNLLNHIYVPDTKTNNTPVPEPSSLIGMIVLLPSAVLLFKKRK